MGDQKRRGAPLVECRTCGMPKKPIGRSVGPAAANDYCGHDCAGYGEEPRPDWLWPGEEEDGRG